MIAPPVLLCSVRHGVQNRRWNLGPTMPDCWAVMEQNPVRAGTRDNARSQGGSRNNRYPVPGHTQGQVALYCNHISLGNPRKGEFKGLQRLEAAGQGA